MTLKARMMLATVSLVAVSGGLSAVIGGYLLWRNLSQEAQNRVRQDLNASQEFYRQRLEVIEAALRYTALGERFSQAVADKDVDYLAPRLAAVRRDAGVDVLCATDSAGVVSHRAHDPLYSGDSLRDDRLVSAILEGKESASGTLLIPMSTLQREGASFAENAKIRLVPKPEAGVSDPEELESGMMVCAAVAVRAPDGTLAGVLRAGALMNSDYRLVDKIQNTVFRDERYRGKLVGTASVFQGGVRIATNVRQEDGARAIGTRVSAKVYDRVLGRGEPWLGAAWVVDDWYISAYAPIYDIDNKPVGMLSVAVLKHKFTNLTLRTLCVFGLVTLAVLLVAGVLGWRLAAALSRPITHLAAASAAIARGELSQALPVEADDEIGSLTQSFNNMAQALKERDELLKEQTRRQLTRSERLASVGRLAAGVAHEINNPLTGVLTFAHMLLKNAPENSEEKEDIQTIVEATMRCRDVIRGLLDFSRQSQPHKEQSGLNYVVRRAINLTENHARINQVEISEQLSSGLPFLVIDPNQIEEVVVNVIVNAIDAMPTGGRLTIRTDRVDGEDTRWVEIEVSDTGCGIEPENLEHIFDPFFTTKPAGTGTGLGLAVAYGIVTDHGGQINVSSVLDHGTTVAVRLPLFVEEPRREEESGACDR